MKLKFPLIVLTVVILFVSACAGSTDTNVAVSVSLTQTAAALAPATQGAVPQGAAPTQSNPQAGAQPPAADAIRIEFQPNSTSWYTNGDLDTKMVRHFVLSAFKEQQMTISLTTEPASSGATIYAALGLSGANGEVFIHSPQTSWSGVLPASQDYYIEIISMSDQSILYTLSIEISAIPTTSSTTSMYEPVSQSICDTIQGIAFDTLETNYMQSPSSPFTDPVSGETGDGCLITGSLTGTSDITSASDIVDRLVQHSGFTEQPAYRADGPTGAATATTRDAALMLIQVDWQPIATVQCPADQPIANCNLTPEQKLYIITINTAQYKANFSLDGHWEDVTTGLSLDLYQDWKNIYGHHTVVAQGGNKIDTLDVSINGSLQGQVATVQFQSAFTTDTGTAQITYIDVNTIQWRIIDPPDGEYYLPAEATLIRK